MSTQTFTHKLDDENFELKVTGVNLDGQTLTLTVKWGDEDTMTRNLYNAVKNLEEYISTHRSKSTTGVDSTTTGRIIRLPLGVKLFLGVKTPVELPSQFTAIVFGFLKIKGQYDVNQRVRWGTVRFRFGRTGYKRNAYTKTFCLNFRRNASNLN